MFNKLLFRYLFIPSLNTYVIYLNTFLSFQTFICPYKEKFVLSPFYLKVVFLISLLDQTNHPSGGCLISPNTFPTLDHVEARSLPFYIIRSLSGGTSSDSERPLKMKARKIESDGSCLLGAAGSGGDGADGLISCSDYLLITIRLKSLAEEENL